MGGGGYLERTWILSGIQFTRHFIKFVVVKTKLDPWALLFLVVREINCGNWLARRYMPAHQHCDVFYPLGWGCDWVYHKLGNAPIPNPEQVLGS